METEVCSPVLEKDIVRAAALICDGQLVAFPTETVYGLGANGLDAAACARIYEAKGRPSDNPLILHIADLSMLNEAAEAVPSTAAHLLTAFAPGPVTVVVPKAVHIPPLVTGGLPTVGVRCPAHDIARRFIRAAGVPIAAPSANTSGRPSPTAAAMVYADMAGRIPLILDGGRACYDSAPRCGDVRNDCGGASAHRGADGYGTLLGERRAACPWYEVYALCAARAAHSLCRNGIRCHRSTAGGDPAPHGSRGAARTDRKQ